MEHGSITSQHLQAPDMKLGHWKSDEEGWSTLTWCVCVGAARKRSHTHTHTSVWQNANNAFTGAVWEQYWCYPGSGVALWAPMCSGSALVLFCVTSTWMFLPKRCCCFQSADRSAEAQMMIVRSGDSSRQLCSINFQGLS